MDRLEATAVRDILSRIPYPGFKKSIVELGLVTAVEVENDSLRIVLQLGNESPEVSESLQQAVRDAVAASLGGRKLILQLQKPNQGTPSLNMVSDTPPAGSNASGGAVDPRLLPGVSKIVAVASAKGGVGKSTVAVHLAAALAASGLRVGLLDADIYGPSIPILLGLRGERPRMTADRKLLPMEKDGLKFMSLGFLVEEDSAVIWRGPMVMKALEQLLRETEWGPLDVLVLDLPPGTGDAQLTLSQRLRLDGSVIVTTPQELAVADVVRGIAMFRKVGVDILGVVENMAYRICKKCGDKDFLFGESAGPETAKRLRVPFLGSLPLDSLILEAAAAGRPLTRHAPDSDSAKVFSDLASRIDEAIQIPRVDAPEGPGIFDRFKKVWGTPES